MIRQKLCAFFSYKKKSDLERVEQLSLFFFCIQEENEHDFSSLSLEPQKEKNQENMI